MKILKTKYLEVKTAWNLTSGRIYHSYVVSQSGSMLSTTDCQTSVVGRHPLFSLELEKVLTSWPTETVRAPRATPRHPEISSNTGSLPVNATCFFFQTRPRTCFHDLKFEKLQIPTNLEVIVRFPVENWILPEL